MPYHLDLTLQQRTIISIATSIWNHKTVKEKITKWSDNRQILKLEGARDEWRQLTSAVVEEINEKVLPPQLRGELIYFVKELGEKIHNWYIYIWNEYYNLYGKQGDIINYIREIYWTSIGTIDEVKILQSFWLKNSDLDTAVVYKIACKNALEEDIDDLWKKMPCSIEYCYDEFYRHLNYDGACDYSHYDHLILDYWEHRTNDRMDHFRNVILADLLFSGENRRAEFNQNYSVEHNMFLISVFEGHSTAAKYFWQKLTQEERDSSVMKSAYITVERSEHIKIRNLLGDYKRDKYCEILIFLINHMTMSQEEAFLRKISLPHNINMRIVRLKNEIISMVSSIWPWQELLIPVLNCILQYSEHNKGSVLDALYEISKKIVEPSDAALKSKYRSIFREVWCIIPGSMKRTMVQNNPNSVNYINFISSLVVVGELGTLNMIFNDPEIVDVRMQYIEFGRRGYKNLIESNKYELLDQFMEKVLRSEEEKKYTKNLINHIVVCEYLIDTRQYDSANKILNWKFETVEERNQCKDRFKDHKFFLNWILKTLKLYGGSVDKAKEETCRFLEWILETEDEIARFKKEFIAESEPLIENVVIDELLLRTLSEEKAQKIRQILA